jgi:hypothetical protein
MGRKIDTNGGYKLYTGPACFRVHKVNPNNDQYFQITKREYPFILDYDKDEKGKTPLRFLIEIAKTNSEDTAVGNFLLTRVNVSKTVVLNKNGDKTLFSNVKGEEAYLPSDGTVPSNMSWFDAIELEPMREGEKTLIALIKALVDFRKEDDWTPYRTLINNFYKKLDVEILNKFFRSSPEGLDLTFGQCGFAALLGVYVSPEGKTSQQVLFETIQKTRILGDLSIDFGYKSQERMVNYLKKQAEAGYPVSSETSSAFQIFDLKAAKETDLITAEEDDDNDFGI